VDLTEARVLFGHAGKCRDLNAVIALQRKVVGDDATQATVAFGMLLAATSTPGGIYRDDALAVLRSLSLAKTEFDCAACHTYPTVDVTADILSSAQKFADENTIPCTEWPGSEDVVNHVLQTVKKYATVKEWRQTLYSRLGHVVGAGPMGDL
jgi:hypothetical protein